MKKILPIMIVVTVLVAGAAFYGGMWYAKKGKTERSADARRERMAQFGGRGGMPGDRGERGGDIVAGEILSHDDKSITVKLRDGGSKIIFYSESTEIGKFVDGTLSDLAVGTMVVVNGQANADGTLNAQSVQIRPRLP